MEKDRNKRDCETCNGTGRINGEYVKEWQNTSWIPMQGEWVTVYKDEKCPTCDGKGHQESKCV